LLSKATRWSKGRKSGKGAAAVQIERRELTDGSRFQDKMIKVIACNRCTITESREPGCTLSRIRKEPIGVHATLQALQKLQL